MQYQLNEERRDLLAFAIYCGIFGAFVLSVLLIRNFYTNKQRYDLVVTDNVDAQISVTPTPTLVIAVEDPDKVYKLNILNSTGVSGLAASTADKFKSQGFKLDTSLGNGEIRTGTNIYFKSESLKSTKVGVFVLSSFPNSSVKIKEGQSYDLVIDLGK